MFLEYQKSLILSFLYIASASSDEKEAPSKSIVRVHTNIALPSWFIQPLYDFVFYSCHIIDIKSFFILLMKGRINLSEQEFIIYHPSTIHQTKDIISILQSK